MAKKSFDNINNPINAFISDKEPAGSKEGKRINMPFTYDNSEYLNIICKLKGTSKTKYVNSLVEADSIKNADVARQAKELIEQMEG